MNQHLPDQVWRFLLSVRRLWWDPYARKSYSQEGEDMILWRIFERQVNGFYVDIGAHHPRRFSNTYFFYRRGWHGINIDALPGAMQAFNRQRPRDTNLEIPVSDNVEELTYYEFNEPALNGFSKDLSEIRNEAERHRIVSSTKMTTMPLADILDKYLPVGQKIDFMTIDVEGWELKVLRSNNWKKYRPHVVLVEIGNSEFADLENNATVQYLVSVGYRVFAKCVNTWIFRLATWKNAREVF